LSSVLELRGWDTTNRSERYHMVAPDPDI
jgi:hypothetical protein